MDRTELEASQAQQLHRKIERPLEAKDTGIRTRWKLQYGRSRARKRILMRARAGGKRILYILIMGVVWGFVAGGVSSFAIDRGFSPAADGSLRNYAFFVGLVLGLGSWLARDPIKDIFSGLLVMPVWGACRVCLAAPSLPRAA